MRLPFAIAAVTLSVSAASAREYYSIKTYQLRSPEHAAAFDKMMAVMIPALERAGVGPVGVFKPKAGKDGDPNWRYVLAAFDSLDKLVDAGNSLADEEELMKAAYDYLAAEKSNPAFDRIEASTFVAFEGFPKLIKPAPDEGGERFFELRVYESHGEFKAYMKVKMFNEGELDIFADVGLRGLFFGRALSGDNLPNLTYMLVYDNEAEHKKAWDAFRKAPAWLALKGEEQYADTVSKIDSKFLIATDYSGIR